MPPDLLRSFRRRIRRFHRRQAGIVLEQAAMIAVVVLTIGAATPVLIALYRDFFYRIASVVSSPFT
jgi:hypothetical protein